MASPLRAHADLQITAERHERKFTIAPDRVQAFAAAMDARLERHRFVGEGANRLPGAHHFITTIYLDTEDRDVYRAAAGAKRNLKLRAREYYDLQPSLTPVVTDLGDLVRYQPVLWLELKGRDGDVTSKTRVVLPKPQVRGFLAGRAPEVGGAEAAAVLRACRGFASPLGASCLVNYRRLAWESPAQDVRVTLDVGLSFFRPQADLWTRQFALVREALGPAAGGERRGVIEIKTLGGLPPAIAGVLDELDATRTVYRKFERASRAVHG